MFDTLAKLTLVHFHIILLKLANEMQKLEEDGGDYGDVKFKLRHFTKFKVLLFVTAFFAVLSIIFMILFAIEKAKVGKPSTPQKSSVQMYCGTKHCLDTSLGKIMHDIMSDQKLYYDKSPGKSMCVGSPTRH